MYYPSLDEFRQKAKQGNLIPVYKEILADMETPVSAFYKIKNSSHAFLLESVEGGENIAQYSFLGSNPSIIFQSKGKRVQINYLNEDKTDEITSEAPLRELERLLLEYKSVAVKGLPPFHGGFVGFLSYDMVRFFEELPDDTQDDLNLPDSLFVLTDTILVFDHVNHKIKVVSNAHITDGADAAYYEATEKIDNLIDTLKRPLFLPPSDSKRVGPVQVTSNFTREAYHEIVRRAKEYIAAGDIIQVVPSQRLSVPMSVDSFKFYRALRTVNPSPYMYYLQLGDLHIAGSSPEMMVRVDGRRVETRPIAGTRRRSSNEAEDIALAEELLADPKERAEHVMLVDLGRNDLGRVCEYGSVHVDEMMFIERYSHVMHIVSNVVGTLHEDKTAFDVIEACFPAGTLSGAPKIRAMEIIDELEPTRRGIYGGAVGYFSFSGNADTAITIRTLVAKDGMAHIQAGGGIVADSEPENEYQETLNKAGALLKALELAESGLE
ncbi:anthranilate synthase component I [bacterium]|nr:anthranilate synthase component I [bacterium]